MRRPRKYALVGAGAAGLLAVGLSVPAYAAAQDDPSPSPSTSSSAPSDKGHERSDEFAAALAKELGIDKDKVADALAKVRSDETAHAKDHRTDQLKDRLAQAVKDGKLTQEQADAIIAAADKGVLPGGPDRGGFHWRR